MKFIYVFNSKDKDTLESAGYKMLKADDKNSVYVFKAEDRLAFALSNVNFIPSNTLTF